MDQVSYSAGQHQEKLIGLHFKVFDDVVTAILSTFDHLRL